MERLANSAYRFNFIFKKEDLIGKLKKLADKFKKNIKYRVRVLLDPLGRLSMDFTYIVKVYSEPVKIAISDKKTDKGDTFLLHKTTKRDVYDSEHEKYLKKGYFDCIFFNKANELTEGAITNIVIEKSGRLFTPPVACGLLPGVYRRYIIHNHKPAVKEKVLFMDDLLKADHIYLINSVRKMVEAKLE